MPLAPTSTPWVGSSSTSTLGCVRRARATTAFCWFPPLSVPERAPRSRGRRSTRSAQRSTSVRSSRRGAGRRGRAAADGRSVTFCDTDCFAIEPNRLRSAGTMPIPSVVAWCGSAGTSAPSTRTDRERARRRRRAAWRALHGPNRATRRRPRSRPDGRRGRTARAGRPRASAPAAPVLRAPRGRSGRST